MVNKARRLLGQATAGQTMQKAALFISGAYLLSALLGLLRERLLISNFGLSSELSAYYVAFRLPELLFALLVSGAFAVAFIPVLSEHLAEEKREQAWRVTSSLLNLLVLATIVGAVVIVVFAGPLTSLIAPGLDGPTHDLAANLTQIMAISPVLFAISSVLGSVQQAFNRFVIFSLAGIMYNLGIITGIYFLADQFGVYGAAYGVVLGVVLQALLQWAGLYGLGFKYRPQINLKLAGVRQTLKLMVPRTINQGVDQINYSVETIIGSLISSQAIVQFTLANSLKNLPLVLIGSSIATAAFPRLAARAAKGARTELIEGYVTTARLILFLAIPAAIFAIFARGYIIRLLYGFGDAATANTLGWFAGTIVFSSLFMLVTRVYYAMQDTKTPLYLSLASIPVNIALSYLFAEHYGVVGLAMSASIVSALNALGLLWILRRREGNFGEGQILSGAWRMLLAGAILAPVLYLTINAVMPLYAEDRGFITLAPKFALIALIGAAAYVIPCYLLGLREAKQAISKLRDTMARSFNLT